MIAELIRFEPPDGRQYEGPTGSLPAMERLRLDCVELHYTKVKGANIDELQEAATVLHGRRPETLLCGGEVDGRQWLEAVVVRYRCAGETDSRYLLGVGYSLTVYGNKETIVLETLLGPHMSEETDE